MSGPAPKPEEVRRAEGYADHRPPREPKIVAGRILPDDELAVPAGMSAIERRAWRDLAAPLKAGGILDAADLTVLELAAAALARARMARAAIAKDGMFNITSQGMGQHPAVAIEKQALAEFRGYAALLGIGPANRTRLGKSAKPDGGMAGELSRRLPPPARLRVVGGGDAD